MDWRSNIGKTGKNGERENDHSHNCQDSIEINGPFPHMHLQSSLIDQLQSQRAHDEAA
jgi:hypothetical protein